MKPYRQPGMKGRQGSHAHKSPDPSAGIAHMHSTASASLQAGLDAAAAGMTDALVNVKGMSHQVWPQKSAINAECVCHKHGE